MWIKATEMCFEVMEYQLEWWVRDGKLNRPILLKSTCTASRYRVSVCVCAHFYSTPTAQPMAPKSIKGSFHFAKNVSRPINLRLCWGGPAPSLRSSRLVKTQKTSLLQAAHSCTNTANLEVKSWVRSIRLCASPNQKVTAAVEQREPGLRCS